MSRERYYLDVLIGDDVLRPLVEKVKDTLQYVDESVKLYQKYNDKLFGQSSHLMTVNNQSMYSPSPVNTRGSAEHNVVSSSPETPFKVSSTPVTRNPNASSLQRKHLPFDDANNEESENETESRDKQSSLVEIRNTSDDKIENPKHLPVENTDDETIQIRSASRIPSAMDNKRFDPKTLRKMLIPVNVVEDDTKPENVPQKRLPLDDKHVANVEPGKLEADTPFRRRSVMDSPQKKDRIILNTMDENTFEVNQKYVSPLAESPETTVNPESEERKSVEISEMSAIFSAAFKCNANPGKENKVEALPTYCGEKNASLAEESRPTANPNKHETNWFGHVKRAKIPHNYPSNVQEADSYDNTKMLGRSDQDSKINISPSQGSKVTGIFEEKRKSPSPRIFEEKRKSPSPRRDAMPFRSMPRFMQSSGGVEIEFDVSWESVGSPKSLSPFSPTDYKSGRTIIKNNGKRRSPKSILFSVDESKSECLLDLSPSAKSTISISPTTAKTSSLSRGDIISLEIDRLFCDSWEKCSPTSRSVETASSQINKHLQLSVVHQFFKCLETFREDLKAFSCLIQNIQYFVQIILIKKDFPIKELQNDILRITKLTSKLMEQVGSWKMDVDTELYCWDKYSIEIDELPKRYEPLVECGQPTETNEFLQFFKEDLKTILKKVDEIIIHADTTRLLFLTSAADLEELMNLFVKFLIHLEIIKPSPLHTL